MDFRLKWHVLDFILVVSALLGHYKSLQAPYIKTSSLFGQDSPTCGTTWQNACATLPGALQVAKNHDVIDLDGTGTSLHPYDCKLQPLEISINVNITSSNTSRANISCPMINIKSSHPTTSSTTVNFTRLTLTNSPIVINDARIVLQDVIVTKTSRYAIRGTYDLLNVTPYVTILESTFEYNKGKMLSFYFGRSPGISRGDAFIIKDTTFKKNNAENTSLLEISVAGSNVAGELKVRFTNLTMDNNVAFRGVCVFSQVTNITTRVSISDSLSQNNDWEWSGIQVQSNNSLYSEVQISRSTFLNNQGVDIGSGPGSCIYIDVRNGPGSVVLSDLRFEKNKAQKISKPVAAKYGCIHIEFDGDSNAKVNNVTSTNGDTSAILYRFEQQNNTLEVINSTFMDLEAAFGAGVLMESWTCKVRQGIYSCFYDTSVDHEVDARFVNCNFFNNRATNKGGAACIAPDSSFKGNLSFIDCNFRNNFALDEGGHIFVGGNTVNTIFENTLLQQTLPHLPDQSKDKGKNMLCYTNNGKVTMINSTIDSDTRGNIQSLVKIVGLRSFEVEGGMKITCPTGTSAELHNSSFATLLPESRESYFTTVLIWSCKSCGYGFYSPSRGSWSNSEPGLHRICYKCPNGADCGEDENIVAEKNWWCYNTSTNDEVSCSHCLEDRCCPMTKGKDLPNPKEYNNCCGNRTGVLCGRCKDGFIESWLSNDCMPYHESGCILMFVLSFVFSIFIVYSISCRLNKNADKGTDDGSSDSSDGRRCSSLPKYVPDLMKYTHSVVSGYQWLGIIIEESPMIALRRPASLVKGTAKMVFSGSIPMPTWVGVKLWKKTISPLIFFVLSLIFSTIFINCLPCQRERKGTSSPDNAEAGTSFSDNSEEGTCSSDNPPVNPTCHMFWHIPLWKILVNLKICLIFKEILPYLLLPLVSMIWKLIIPVKINDKCYNMFAPEGQSCIWKLQSKLSWLCFGDSNGLPLTILIVGLLFLILSERCYKTTRQKVERSPENNRERAPASTDENVVQPSNTRGQGELNGNAMESTNNDGNEQNPAKADQHRSSTGSERLSESRERIQMVSDNSNEQLQPGAPASTDENLVQPSNTSGQGELNGNAMESTNNDGNEQNPAKADQHRSSTGSERLSESRERIQMVSDNSNEQLQPGAPASTDENLVQPSNTSGQGELNGNAMESTNNDGNEQNPAKADQHRSSTGSERLSESRERIQMVSDNSNEQLQPGAPASTDENVIQPSNTSGQGELNGNAMESTNNDGNEQNPAQADQHRSSTGSDICHRKVWRYFVNILIAFVGVYVVVPAVKQSSIIICLFALFVRLYHSSHDPSISPELRFELLVIAFSAFVSFLTIGTQTCNSLNDNIVDDWSLSCSLHKLRFVVLILLFFISIVVVVGLLIVYCIYIIYTKCLQNSSSSPTVGERSPLCTSYKHLASRE